jgi:hypothetical protein
LASGPSLSQDQVERVLAWRDAGAGRRIIVTNTTFTTVPTADALFAQDRAWWKHYRAQVLREFKGEPWTCLSGIDGVGRVPGSAIGVRGLRGWVGNSGGGAILLAAHFGAARIYLLGYDSHTRGGVHHHGDHPPGLGNAKSLPSWQGRMARVAAHVAAPVINLSPGTALKAFPLGELKDVIA